MFCSVRACGFEGRGREEEKLKERRGRNAQRRCRGREEEEEGVVKEEEVQELKITKKGSDKRK